MAKLPLYLAARGIDGAQRSPVWFCFVGRKIGAAVISMAHIIRLRRSAEDVALLARGYIEKTGSGIEAWRHPVRGTQCSRANRSPLGRWRALIISDRAPFCIFAVAPSGSTIGIGQEQFARSAIQHVEETVAVGLSDQTFLAGIDHDGDL